MFYYASLEGQEPEDFDTEADAQRRATELLLLGKTAVVWGCEVTA